MMRRNERCERYLIEKRRTHLCDEWGGWRRSRKKRWLGGDDRDKAGARLRGSPCRADRINQINFTQLRHYFLFTSRRRA